MVAIQASVVRMALVSRILKHAAWVEVPVTRDKIAARTAASPKATPAAYAARAVTRDTSVAITEAVRLRVENAAEMVELVGMAYIACFTMGYRHAAKIYPAANTAAAVLVVGKSVFGLLPIPPQLPRIAPCRSPACLHRLLRHRTSPLQARHSHPHRLLPPGRHVPPSVDIWGRDFQILYDDLDMAILLLLPHLHYQDDLNIHQHDNRGLGIRFCIKRRAINVRQSERRRNVPNCENGCRGDGPSCTYSFIAELRVDRDCFCGCFGCFGTAWKTSVGTLEHGCGSNCCRVGDDMAVSRSSREKMAKKRIVSLVILGW